MTNLYQIKDEALSDEDECFSHEKNNGDDEDLGEYRTNKQAKGSADSDLMCFLKKYMSSKFTE